MRCYKKKAGDSSNYVWYNEITNVYAESGKEYKYIFSI